MARVTNWFRRRCWYLLALFVLAGCTKEPLHHQQSYVFGTLVEVSVWGEDEARAQASIGKVLREFDRLNQELHAWKPSELTRANDAFAKGETFKASPELTAIVTDAARYAERSGDTFNPAIGKLIALWGFHSEEFKPRIPEASHIDRLTRANPRMRDIAITPNGVASNNRDVQLDLGGYAKGYALDAAAKMLRADGVQNALVNIGGNIIALGERGNRPWRIGVQHPRKPAAVAVIDLYDGEAVGTSGDYQRYFELDGKRYCHLIDPRTGRPVQGVQAVTVIAKRGATAGVVSDVASKPIFIAGKQGWREAAKAIDVDLVMFIDDKSEIYMTTLMAKRVEIQDKSAVVHEVP
jgi:FAD:protein FMN transferase